MEGEEEEKGGRKKKWTKKREKGGRKEVAMMKGQAQPSNGSRLATDRRSPELQAEVDQGLRLSESAPPPLMMPFEKNCF